jgi:hypothetical protein
MTGRLITGGTGNWATGEGWVIHQAGTDYPASSLELGAPLPTNKLWLDILGPNHGLPFVVEYAPTTSSLVLDDDTVLPAFSQLWTP